MRRGVSRASHEQQSRALAHPVTAGNPAAGGHTRGGTGAAPTWARRLCRSTRQAMRTDAVRRAADGRAPTQCAAPLTAAAHQSQRLQPPHARRGPQAWLRAR
jgi:hypothetical protein